MCAYRYKSKADAAALGLFAVDPQTGVVRLGVDSKNVYDIGEGRPSIRLESKQTYNHGLFIADFLHMPASECGVWPAFWSYGPDWPNGGEVDIIEGANNANQNLMSVHTAPGCKLTNSMMKDASGAVKSKLCDGANNSGCNYVSPDDDGSSYGDSFNAAKGGVYAMQWDNEHINLWHFSRDNIPSDITTKKPDPESWGMPQARFGGLDCDVGKYFKDMSVVINTNFCGDYGNAAWEASTCATYAPTCSQWVAENPKAFANAYWDISYIDAYVRPADTNFKAATDDLNSLNSVLADLPTGTPGLPTGTPGLLPTVTPPSLPKLGQTKYVLAGTSTPTPTPTGTPAAGSTADLKLESEDINVPTADLPTATDVPKNPTKIGSRDYLGCFGSSNNFETFYKKGSDSQMTLEMCTEMCGEAKYAGVFSTGCYCADELDANTRTTRDEGSCNSPCPGNPDEFCGGRLNGTDLAVQTPANTTDAGNQRLYSVNGTEPGNATTPMSTGGTASVGLPVSTASASVPAGTTSAAMPLSTAGTRRFDTIRRFVNWHGTPRFKPRAAADVKAVPSHLLSVYGMVKDEMTPLPAPNKPGANSTANWKVVSPVEYVVPMREVITMIPIQTVNFNLIVDTYIAVTLKVENKCGCHDDLTALPPVPMTTSVLHCHRCGKHDEDEVTVTVPCTTVVEQPKPTEPGWVAKPPAPPAGNWGDNTPAQPTDIVVTAGASGVRAGAGLAAIAFSLALFL